MKLTSEKIGLRLDKVTRLAENVLVDHKAYLEASAEKKKLDIAKFRKKVIADIQDKDKSEDDDDNNYSNPNSVIQGRLAVKSNDGPSGSKDSGN